MPRACLLLLLLLAACRQEAEREVRPISRAPAAPRTAQPAPAAPPSRPEPVVAFQSPHPKCANVQPIRVGGVVERPELLRRVEPVYPDERVRVAGVTLFELIVNEEGRVCTIVVLREVSPAVDRAIVEAVRQWRFRPARLRGKPVAVAYTITVQVHPRP